MRSGIVYQLFCSGIVVSRLRVMYWTRAVKGIHGDGRRSFVLAAKLPSHITPRNIQFLFDNAAAGGKVNYGVPDALQRKHASAGHAQLEADFAVVSQTIQSVD